jgi:hypothetical protein
MSAVRDSPPPYNARTASRATCCRDVDPDRGATEAAIARDSPARNPANVVAGMTMRWGAATWRRVSPRHGAEPRTAPDETAWEEVEPAAEGSAASLCGSRIGGGSPGSNGTLPLPSP